jgi:hypothetical protein
MNFQKGDRRYNNGVGFQYSQHTQIGKKVKLIFVTTENIFKTNWDNFEEQLFFGQMRKA